jgi:hypothetical protein
LDNFHPDILYFHRGLYYFLIFRKRFAQFGACFMLASYLVYSLTLKMAAIRSSEPSVDF